MRLIDADALIEFCAERWIPLNIDAVNMQPTIQPEKAQLSKESATSDLISRQQAIDALKEHRALYCDNTPETFSKLSHVEKSRVDELDTAIATLVNLPTIQPEPQEGRFERKRDGVLCSVCHYGWEFITGVPAEVEREYHYCPNCGAKMTISK